MHRGVEEDADRQAAGAFDVLTRNAITPTNDDAVAALDDMLSLLERPEPGDAMTLTAWRAGQQRNQPVVFSNSEWY